MILKFSFAAVFLALSIVCVQAQIDASSPSGRPQPKEELPKGIKEALAKQRIEKEKKDHDEMIRNAEEAIKLSEELQASAQRSDALTGEDKKKLDRLEKILKKIRKELGGDDDGKSAEENVEERPSTIGSALRKLQSTAADLLDELKKTSRFSISAAAIQSSNTLLKIVRFLRFSK